MIALYTLLSNIIAAPFLRIFTIIYIICISVATFACSVLLPIDTALLGFIAMFAFDMWYAIVINR
jgi:hypothetical protein